MFTTNVQLRFRDTDAMGHVNNAVFLTYLELARIEFFKDIFGVNRSEEIQFILARVEIDFKHPILMENKPVVEMWVTSIGNSSWWFAYKIVDQDDSKKTFAEAKSVQVVYDYENNKKIMIPDKFKLALEKYLL